MTALALAALLVVTDVTVVDVETGRLLPHRDVVVDGERIAKVVARDGAAPSYRAGTHVIDGAGKYLIPGLIDAHVHLTMLEGGALAQEVLLPMFLRHGVTGVRDMGGDLEKLAALRDGVRRGTIAGPRIVTPGPFLDGSGEAPTAIAVTRDAEAQSAVAEVARRKADFVKVQAGLSPEAWRAILRYARAKKIAVAGHVPEAVSAFEVAASSQRTIEHVSPVLPGDAGVMMACTADEAGLRAGLGELNAYGARNDAVLATYRTMQRAWTRRLVEGYDDARCRALAAKMRASGVAWVPTLAWARAAYPTSADDTPAVDPAIPEALRTQWAERRHRQIASSSDDDYAVRRLAAEASAALVLKMRARGVTILAGTDGVDAFDTPGGALHREIALLAEAGLTPAEALRAATCDAARVLGFADAGIVAKGKRADLVLLDADPLQDPAAVRRIAAVVAGGRVVPRE